MVADYARLTCRQRKKLRAVKHARELRLGTLSDTDLSARDKRRYNANITHVCQTPLRSTECQNRGENTFRDKYARHTLHSIAEHKTYNPPTRAPMRQFENSPKHALVNLPFGKKTYVLVNSRGERIE